MMVLAIYIIILLAIYAAPLTFTCPCVMDHHSLGPRPDIIGRRGAPMVRCSVLRLHHVIQLTVLMIPVCCSVTSVDIIPW